MARLLPQLEFRWVSWLRVRAAPAPLVPGRPTGTDGALTAWCVETARALNLTELASRVRVSWNPRMKTTAGRAWWPDRAIELNPKLQGLPSDEVWCTLKHELAHLITFERAGRRRTAPHGPEWRAACAELGIAGEQPFHTLPFKPRRLKRTHTYYCVHCLVELHRVRPLGKAVACYACCRKHNQGRYHPRFRLLPKLP